MACVMDGVTRRPSKYNAIKTDVDGVTFDSKAEARRYAELKLMQQGGLIQGLVLQPRFPLLVNDQKVGIYVADFQYWDLEEQTSVVEDVKSPATKTAIYRLKKKIVHAIYGFDIQEVMG